MKMYRQGDVLLVEEKLDYDEDIHEVIRPESGYFVLMHGEATGHHHSFTVEEHEGNIVHFKHRDKKRMPNQTASFLKVKRTAYLKHQEHDTIPVKPGTYKVLRQREYSPGRVPVYVRD